MWILLGMAGLGEKQRTPQYKYWSRPQQMDDCGQNLLEGANCKNNHLHQEKAKTLIAFLKKGFPRIIGSQQSLQSCTRLEGQ
jgi:hypothetical protein